MSKFNRKIFKIMLVIGIVGVAAVGTGLATAQGSGQGQGQGKGEGFRLERMAAHLGLTAEQQETIKSLGEKSSQEAVQLRKDLMRLRNEMQGEMLKDAPSEKNVLSLNEKMGDVKTELKANRLKMRLAVREQLTPEQRDQMLTMGGKGSRGDREFNGRHGHGGKGRAEGRRGGRGHGRGQCDGTGPRAGTDCPQNTQ